MSQSEHTITIDVIRSLLDERINMGTKLLDLKRLTIITLATNSNAAAELILNELRTRLVAVQDVASAEILGKLIELDFPLVDKYIKLAMEILDSGL